MQLKGYIRTVTSAWNTFKLHGKKKASTRKDHNLVFTTNKYFVIIIHAEFSLTIIQSFGTLQISDLSCNINYNAYRIILNFIKLVLDL